MSPSDTSTPSPRRFAIHCHAVETGTETSSPCARHLDAAVLVGLSLAYARQRAAIPQAVAAPLNQLAEQGDATCRLVVDWLENRTASVSDPDVPVLAVNTSEQVARSHRQRALEGPRGNRASPPSTTRGRPRLRFSNAAIIAANEESR